MTTFDETTPKKMTMQEISTILRDFDFVNYDPYKDKAVLMETLQIVNAKLGKLLRGFTNG